MITIDGPAGAGKGVVAGYLAKRLGWRRLDSGALYRALALALLREGLVESGEARIAATLKDWNLAFDTAPGEDRVFLNGEDVTEQIRTEQVGEAASLVAPLPAVRRFLLPQQRRFRQPPGLVAEGRDMASVVFPDAPLQIYLKASLEIRAERRHKQLKKKGIDANIASLIRDLAERDRRDTNRSLAPLKQVRRAEVLDTTALNVRETKHAVWRLVTALWPQADAE